MATEASTADQTAEGHVEEVKVINDVKDIDKEYCPESKDLEGKDEEITVEDSTGAAAPAIESETAVVSEVKQDDNKSESAADVKKEETEVEKASDPLTVASIENEESSKQEVESSTTEPKEEADSAAVEPSVESVGKQPESQVEVESDGKEPKSHVEVTDTAEPPQPSTEASIENLEATLMQQLESETSNEPAVPEAAAEETHATPEAAVTDTAEHPQPLTDALTENLEATLMQHLESETTKEPAVPEATAEEANATPEVVAEEVNPTSDTSAEEVNPIPEEVDEKVKPSPEAAAEEANTSPEAAPVEVNTTEELQQVSSVSVPGSREAESPVVSSVTESAADDITIAGVSDTADTSIGETIKLEASRESHKEEVAGQGNTTPEAATEEANTTPKAVATEKLPHISSVPVMERKEAEPPVVSPVTDLAPDDITIAGVSDTAETSIGETIKLDENTDSQKEEEAAQEAHTSPEAAAEESNTTTEAADVEVNTTEEFPPVSSASVTESKEAEPPVVSPWTDPALDDIKIAVISDTAETSIGETIMLEENTESQKEEPLVTDSGKLEEAPDTLDAVVSESADAVATKAALVTELKEGEEADVTEEVSNAPQLVEGDQNASASAEESVSLDASPISETIESSVQPYIKVEEMQETAVVAEEPSITTESNDASKVHEVSSDGSSGVERVDEKEYSMEGSIESLKDPDAATKVPQVSSEGEKASEGVEEKMYGSLEGEKPTLVETSRGIDVEETKDNVNTESDSLVSEKTEKDDEKTPAESAKDAGEATKAEVHTKSSQRTIFSKVKQSIVKVKKAIIGKSPSSKTISTEGKDEAKAK